MVDVQDTSAAPLLLAPTARAPTAAREHVAAWCNQVGLRGASDVATLIVTELVTNAVRHARTPLTLTAARIGDRLRLDVADGSPETPLLRSADLLDEGGRGLFLVDALADGWGIDPCPDGKRVWAEIALEPCPA